MSKEVAMLDRFNLPPRSAFHCFSTPLVTTEATPLGTALIGSLDLWYLAGFSQWKAPTGGWRAGGERRSGCLVPWPPPCWVGCSPPGRATAPFWALPHTATSSSSGNCPVRPRGWQQLPAVAHPGVYMFPMTSLNPAQIIANTPFLKFPSIVQFECATCFLLGPYWWWP